MAGFGIEISGRKTRFNNADTGRFEWEVTAGTEAAVKEASEIGARSAAEIYGGSGLGWHLIFRGDDGIHCGGQWAEAAEFGIPGHIIDTDKYSLYNADEGFPSVINPRTGKPIRVQRVNHPGTPEVAMVRSAGDEVAAMFDQILVDNLP